ncbi:MAG: hypothetical protein QM817_40830 [Archangium sp.]
MRRNFTEALNSELDFLRLWGLSKFGAARVIKAAESSATTPLALVQRWVLEAAIKQRLLAAPKPAPESGTERCSVNITGPNEALLAFQSVEWGTEISQTANRLLEFCRSFGLPPDLERSLAAEASRRGGTLRDLVQTIIADAAARLPDPKPARAELPPKRRRTR